jgi:hypothetical protein
VVVVRADGLDSIVTLNGFTALAKSFTVTGLRPGSATLTASCRDARRQIGVDIVDN